METEAGRQVIPPSRWATTAWRNWTPLRFLDPVAPVARRLPAYELRNQQLEMAQAVARAIEGPGHLIVEAGTGVGKSFAYLVPSILAAVEQEEDRHLHAHDRAAGAVASQGSPVPAIRDAPGVLGRPGQGAVQLHQPARLDVAGARATGTFQKQEEFDQLGEIKLWANRTTDGSRSDLDFRPLPGVWDAVQSENGNCLGRDCPRNKECFYFQARRRVWSANLLIVNHALSSPIWHCGLRALGCFPSTTWRSLTRAA